MTQITDEMVEDATLAFLPQIFATHEMPVDDTIWHRYKNAMRLALRAALSTPPRTDAAEVGEIAEVLKQYPVRCSNDLELDELRRREAARAVLALASRTVSER